MIEERFEAIELVIEPGAARFRVRLEPGPRAKELPISIRGREGLERCHNVRREGAGDIDGDSRAHALDVHADLAPAGDGDQHDVIGVGDAVSKPATSEIGGAAWPSLKTNLAWRDGEMTPDDGPQSAVR